MHDSDFAAAVVAWLGARTVACAESCTAGRLSQAFAAVGGAEDWFRGGLVAYQVPVKRSLLGVTAASVLNEEAAKETFDPQEQDKLLARLHEVIVDDAAWVWAVCSCCIFMPRPGFAGPPRSA